MKEPNREKKEVFRHKYEGKDPKVLAVLNDPSYVPKAVIDKTGRITIKRNPIGIHPNMITFLNSMVERQTQRKLFSTKGTMSPFNAKGKRIRAERYVVSVTLEDGKEILNPVTHISHTMQTRVMVKYPNINGKR